MNFLIDNWYLIVGILALVVGVIFLGIRFFEMPTEKQIAAVKEWLKWAVVEAEKELGTGTGQLKLHMVYDMAISQFEWVGRLITFDMFSEWVDEALQWMEKQLFTNDNVAKIVKGENYGK